jgi:hypothetical protein
MYDLRKLVQGDSTWSLTGRIGSDKLGMLFFQPQKFLEKEVVFAVSNQWIIEVVIAMSMFLEEEP